MNPHKCKGLLFLLLAVLLLSCLCPAAAPAEEDVTEEVLLDEETDSAAGGVSSVGETSSPAPRDAFIEDIIALGRELYEKADGKYQRAHYKGDIYV